MTSFLFKKEARLSEALPRARAVENKEPQEIEVKEEQDAEGDT